MRMSIMIGRDAKIIELDGDNTIFSITFAEDDKHILCGSQDGVLLADHDARVAKMTLEAGSPVYAVVVSKDGRWIVTGGLGKMVVWDARNHKKVHEMKEHNKKQCVSAIDVSNDSTRVVSGSDDKTVRIFSITSGQRIIDPIRHENYVIGVKFSPGGERMATAAVNGGGVRVFDAYTGVQLCDIPIPVDRNPSTPLAWSTDGRKLFVVCPGKVVSLDSLPEGPLISWHSEWAIQNSNSPVSIANSGRFIVCSAGSSISFWGPSSYKQLGNPILHSAVVRCLAISSDGRLLVCGTKDKRIMVHNLREKLDKSCFTVEPPLMHVSEEVIQSWIQDNPKHTETMLSEEITQHYNYHAFANRALIRARLKQWNAAIDDATKSLEIKPSPIGHIAHALALVSQDKREAALWAFDLAFRDCDRSENKFLLLIKSILLYVSGKHDDAISRVRDLIPPEDDNTAYCCTQVLATMYLNIARYEHAIQSFQRLLALPDKNPYLMTISLIFGEPFNLIGVSAQRRVCETLCVAGYTKEAAEMFLRVANMLSEETPTNQGTTDWHTEFTRNCVSGCEHNGDVAFKSAKFNEAIAQYTAALSLDPPIIVNLLIKRGRVQAAAGLWDDALRDADKAIETDPSCPWGYEEKHAALYGAQRYDEAIQAYGSFLSAIEKSHDPGIYQLRQTYMSPAQIMEFIDEEVGKVPTTCPFVLIDATSGRLCHQTERFHVFQQSLVFKRLVSSITKVSDHEQIVQAVAVYFGYVMLSHAWEGEEPSYQDVNSVGSVWNLDTSACPLKTKLCRFCEEVRRLGYFWAWSDTCCIDKKTNSELVINQSLTLMYQWYENSVATLVLLANVEPGLRALTRSRWITRSWTLQELLAPKVVRFYDCNWKPYLGDTRANHKEPGAIMEELSGLMGISPGIITTFHPNRLTAREKLRLASTRNAREEEDEAYSLIGIFESDIRPKYGERKAALGNLLQEIISRSDDVTILAWNGTSSQFNSCLPLSPSVYSQPPHTVETIAPQEMAKRVTALRTRVQEDQVLVTYDQIIRLPPVRFGNRRLHLPCIVFPVRALDRFHENPRVYRAKVSGLGEVEFVTADSLPLDHPHHLVFVHPWIREIRGSYDRVHHGWGYGVELTADSDAGRDEVMDIDSEAGSSMALHQVPSTSYHKYTRALQLIACLGQSFNALVLVRQPEGHFKRVAAENKIIASGLTCHISSLRDIHVGVVDIL